MGLTAGSGSLVRNIGSGLVTSVTNMAASISRNMDHLSLDEGWVREKESCFCEKYNWSIICCWKHFREKKHDFLQTLTIIGAPQRQL